MGVGVEVVVGGDKDVLDCLLLLLPLPLLDGFK